jgi:hypothetical protein
MSFIMGEDSKTIQRLVSIFFYPHPLKDLIAEGNEVRRGQNEAMQRPIRLLNQLFCLH